MPRTGKSPGRPRVGPLIKVCLPEDLIEKAEAHARETGRQRTDVIREWTLRGAEEAARPSEASAA